MGTVGSTPEGSMGLTAGRYMKRHGFTVLSLASCVLQTALLGLDLASHFLLESGSNSSQHFTVIVLVSHVASFHWALVASMSSLLLGRRSLQVTALLIVVLNLILCVGRTWFEFFIMKFRAETY